MIRGRWVPAVAILGAVLGAVGLGVTTLQKQDAEDTAVVSATELNKLAEQNQAACKRLGVAAAEKVLGPGVCQQTKQIVDRPGPPGKTGAAGSQGVQGAPGPGPSSAQVAAAVASYCEGGRCDGRGPSVAQVAQAVASYCNAKGECRGPVGVAGKDSTVAGPQGVQGPQGVPGESATAEQVAAAVTTYCGQDSSPCQGKAGAPGQPGADSTVPGPPGPQGIPGVDSSAEKCSNASGELQQITVQTGDPLQPAKVLVCVLK